MPQRITGLEERPRTLKLADDILVMKRDENELVEQAEHVLEQCRKQKITVSDSGIQFENERRFVRNVNGENIDIVSNSWMEKIRAKLVGYHTKLLWTRGLPQAGMSQKRPGPPRINGEKFKTLPKQSRGVCNHVNGRGSERFGEQFTIEDQVWVRDHKTRQWSEEAKIIAVLGKRTFHLNNGTKEFARNRRFLWKMQKAKVETTPMFIEGAATQGHQAQSVKQWGRQAQGNKQWGRQAQNDELWGRPAQDNGQRGQSTQVSE